MSNVLESSPSPRQLRTLLEEMVVGDLLGPAAGPEEELIERNVRDRYLVGVLAPRPQAQPAPVKPEEEEEEETPLLPDELSEGGADTVDDGTTDKDVPVVQAHIPSSFGLTFCVDKSAKVLKVEARWGQYKREKKPDQIDTRTGRPLRVWKRYQRSGIVKVRLDKVAIPPTTLHDDFPNVYIKGQVRKRDHGIIVTLFLVNGQEEGKPKDEYHLFQTELLVSDPDGAAVFCKRLTRRTSSKLDPGIKLEEDTMGMLYRHNAEFAVGHGVSVHAEPSPEAPDRAVLVKTAMMPSYEVPRTTPPTAADAAHNPAFGKLAGLVLDMKELAETPQKQLRGKLQPLLAAYSDWIEQQAAFVAGSKEKLADYDDAPAEAIKKCGQNLIRIEAGLKLLEEDAQAAEAFGFMNRAMWLQRTHSLYLRAGAPGRAARLRQGHRRAGQPNVVSLPVGLHPAQPAGHHEARSSRPQRRTRSRCRRPAVLPHRRRQDGSLPGPVGLHDGPAAIARNGGRAVGRERHGRADAVHAALAHHPAVPAGHGADLCLRVDSPQGSGTGRQAMGRDAVPHRPVGGPAHHAQQDRRCR